MKKFVALSLSCLLAASLAVFVGCGDNGTISGNYKEVTADEDWNKAAAALNPQTIFGDQEDENWKFGIDLNANFDLSTKVDEEKAKSNGDFEYLFAFAQSEADTPNMTGAGRAEFSINLPAASEEETPTNASLNGNLYSDNEKLYIDGAITEGENELSGKYYIDISQILGSMGGLEGMLPLSDELPLTGESSSAPDADGAALKEALDEMDLKLEADFSAGTKLKISATDETFKSLAHLIILQQGGIYPDESYEYNRSVFEMYLHLDENGMFVEAAMNFNINLDWTLQAPAFGSIVTIEEQDFNITLKGSASIKATAELPVLPEDLDTYNNFMGA